MPRGYRKWVEKYLTYAGIEVPPENYIGFSVLYGLAFSLIIAFLFLLNILPLKFWFLVIALPTGFEIFMHASLVTIADAKAKFVEEVLPDILRLLSANLRSGLTIDKALLLSARPEFGFLEKELKTAAKETVAGKTIERAFYELGEKVNSKLLKRTLILLTEGIARGGNLPKLLDSLAEDIREIKTLKKEVNSVVLMYVIFIFFAAGIGAPLLYSISTFLVETISKIAGSIEVKPVAMMRMPFLTFKPAAIKTSFLNMYALIAIIITSIFGGLLIGLVQEGKERAGLKYIPILLIVSLFVYFIAKMFIIRALGGMIAV